MNFLKITPSARAQGLGESFVAVYDDPNAVFFNPAGAYTVNKTRFSFTHIEYLLNIKYETLSIAKKTGSAFMALTAGFLYTYDIPHTLKDENEVAGFRDIGKFGFSDKLVGITYSRIITDTVFGGTLKYLNETIESVEAAGFAFDFGVLRITKKFNFGFSIQNIADRIKYLSQYEEIPYIIRAGFLYKEKPFNLHYELTKPSDAEFENKLGVEAFLHRSIDIQFGIRNSPSKPLQTGIYSLTLGTSIKFLSYRIDYSIAGFKDFGPVHRISLAGSF